MKRILCAAFVFCAALTPPPAHPQDAAAGDERALLLDAPPPAASGEALRQNEQAYSLDDASLQGGSSVWAVLRIFLTLALVALAIYGIVYVLKKGRRKDAPEDKHLKLLAALPINARTAAAVVSVGGKAWLVGVADASVTLISPIEEQETVDAMLLDYSERAAASPAGKFPNFLALLRRAFPAENTPAARADSIATPNDTLRKNRDRLKGL